MQKLKLKAIFVSGTGTGVGKTLVTGFLARYLLEKGYNAKTQKWITTGSRKPPSVSSPYVFKAPCSPHLAAQIEGRKIKVSRIIKSFKELYAKSDFLIVEGTGGALVPFNNKGLLIDIAKRLNLPVLIVAENKLGAINHTLLTQEAFEARRLRILGILFNNINKERKLILEDNPRIIKAFAKQRILGVIPRGQRRRDLYAGFAPIGERIFRLLSAYE